MQQIAQRIEFDVDLDLGFIERNPRITRATHGTFRFFNILFYRLRVRLRYLRLGRSKWVCNFCKHEGPVPQSYQCPLDSSGLRRDRHQRAELSQGSVDFAVPKVRL